MAEDDYDHFDIYDSISTCEKASVFEVLRDNKVKVTRSTEDFDAGWWQMTWEHGALGMIGPPMWTEAQAQCCAAMTVYLYLKTVPIDLAKDFGRAYVDYRSRTQRI